MSIDSSNFKAPSQIPFQIPFQTPSRAKKFFLIFFVWGSSFFFALSYDIFSEDGKKQSEFPKSTEERSTLLAPLRSQERYISLLFAGDTHFNWGVANLQKEEGLLAPVKEIQALFAEVDFRALNLEGVLTNKGYPLKGKSYIFHSLSNNVSVLKYLKIDLAILGNNHSMDMGLPGLMDMRMLLAQSGIGAVGAGRNRKQALEAYHFEPSRFNKKKKKETKKTQSRKFALLSLSRVGHADIFSNSSRPGVAKNLDAGTLLKLSKEATAIVSLHWGREYFLQPSITQVKLAHRLIEKGASAVIGHHPHVPQAVELYKKGVIFYSLGNFLFGSVNDLQRDNIIAILDYNRVKGNLERVRIVPIQGRYGQRGHKVRILNMQEAQSFWKRYYIIIKKHSYNTAKRLSIEKGIGILKL